MNSVANPTLVTLEQAMQARGAITAEDVLTLRRLVYGGPQIGQDLAQAILNLNRQGYDTAPTWRDFFVEALADYFFWQRDPLAELNDDDATLLREWVAPEGRLQTLEEVTLFTAIATRAAGAPESLKAFTLENLGALILEGVGTQGGALCGNGVREAVCVTPEHLDLLRRLLYGQNSGRPKLTQVEAELLFAINNATATRGNCEAWKDFFVKAVSLHLLYSGEYQEQVDDRQVAWLESQIREGRACYSNEVALLEYLDAQASIIHPAAGALRERLMAAQGAC